MLHFSKGNVCRQAHVGIPPGIYEEEHGREGFYGPVSHLYHANCPIGWTRIEGPLKPQAFDTNRARVCDVDFVAGQVRLMHNEDVAIGISHFSQPMDFVVRNADGDEALFVHRGQGYLESDYGPLAYAQGDYIVIPKGTNYRIRPQVSENTIYLIESKGRIRQPDRGLMGQHALYDPALVETPTPPSALPVNAGGREWEVRIKRENEWTSVFYPFDPIDVVGWKGTLTVWKLNIRDFRPVMSHRAHLAPSVHTTFQSDGWVVASFVPRPLESDPEAQRVPFYHRNIDYDEVIFYHDGDFFSRHGIRPGMITLHPAGIHHGPHPKAVEASWQKAYTDEVAVMIDTEKPLKVSGAARIVEWPEYHLSWRDTESSSSAGVQPA
jgi:homogentisate 1,2-dioxygenase